jgi:hypothetical protein
VLVNKWQMANGIGGWVELFIGVGD